MYQFNWSNIALWKKEENINPGFVVAFTKKNVYKTALINWQEHCLECSAPTCYRTCKLFEERLDKQCKRLKYGIYQNKKFRGLYNFGVDLRFKKWAKLESVIYFKSLSLFENNLFQLIDLFIINIFKFCAIFFNLSFFLDRFYCSVKHRIFKKFNNINYLQYFDEFILECFSPEKKLYNLIIECETYRNSFLIKPGYNFFSINIKEFSFLKNLTNNKNIFLKIFPENDEENRIIFTWLDFVKYKDNVINANSQIEQFADKVKCVAWDLDNTLWEGIFIESKENEIEIKESIINIIKKIDSMGILQTIVSKNEYIKVWPLIEKYNLQNYFLYPAINWSVKSSNLKEIARRLNININSFALIDDSIFEREEVKNSLPQVRVYSEKEIFSFLEYEEFNVQITELSKVRRLSYIDEIKRECVKESFSNNYLEFLKNCKMQIEIFVPKNISEIERCHELIQRTNQLNLSLKRYSKEEFFELLKNNEILNLAIYCKDRFGDYGIIGFASVKKGLYFLELNDFVISCRVAQKRVEQTFFKGLINIGKNLNKKSIKVKLNKSNINSPLIKVFEEIIENKITKNDNYIELEYLFENNISKIINENIIDLKINI